MAKRALIRHPASPGDPISACAAEISIINGQQCAIEYVLSGDIDRIRRPKATLPKRTDGLWQSTCLEAFLMSAQGHYRELNFSPSSCWAAYDFSAYRANMAAAPLADPVIMVEATVSRLTLRARFSLGPFEVARIGLSAVIEARDGTKSYWALAHPQGAPDFHHEDCFALTLPPPEER